MAMLESSIGEGAWRALTQLRAISTGIPRYSKTDYPLSSYCCCIPVIISRGAIFGWGLVRSGSSWFKMRATSATRQVTLRRSRYLMWAYHCQHRVYISAEMVSSQLGSGIVIEGMYALPSLWAPHAYKSQSTVV